MVYVESWNYNSRTVGWYTRYFGKLLLQSTSHYPHSWSEGSQADDRNISKEEDMDKPEWELGIMVRLMAS